MIFQLPGLPNKSKKQVVTSALRSNQVFLAGLLAESMYITNHGSFAVYDSYGQALARLVGHVGLHALPTIEAAYGCIRQTMAGEVSIFPISKRKQL